MRADRLILEGAGHTEHRALIRRHRKMIGPKVDEAFGKRPLGESSTLGSCQYLRAVVRQIGVAHRVEGLRGCGLKVRRGTRVRRGLRGGFALHFLELIARRQQLGKNPVGSRQRRISRERHRAFDLCHQPGARIAGGGGEIPWPRAQTKTQHGYFRLYHATVTAKCSTG
jgi:hypothetical protein